jgi:hypothetical protein
MSEMVERVARILFDANEGKYVLEREPKAWEYATPIARLFFETVARAAINAMREPTEAMRDACHRFDQECDSNVYSHMIDTALK